MALRDDLHKLTSLTELPVGAVEAATALDAPVGDVLDAGRSLTDDGTLREDGSGWVATEPLDLSGPERAVLAAQLAAAVDVSDAGRKGRLLAMAGNSTEALPLLIEAGRVGDAKAAEAALDLGPAEPSDAGQLHLALAAHHSSRGETLVALDHATRSLPLLEGAATIDALGFIAQQHDFLQEPQAASTWGNLAAGAALNEGDLAKAGSLLTFAGRAMSRLGMAEEAANATEDGLALVEAHGSPTQKARARNNRAWVYLDHGDATKAAAAFDSISDLAEYLGGDVEEASRYASEARALFHAGQSALGVDYFEESVRLAGDAPAPNFLAHLGFAEGATLHGMGESAVDAAERAVAITESDMNLWRNVSYLTLARAERVAGMDTEAAEHLQTALDHTPAGIDGLRIRLRCEVERLAQLGDREKWPKDEAATLTDLLLQSRWYATAVELLTLRAEREKGTDVGAQAVALAARIGNPLLAARAAEVAGLWDKPAGAAAAELIRDTDPHVAEAWRETWDSLPEVQAALAVPETLSSEGVEERLDQALTRAGLTGEVLSPAQRSEQGLEYAGRRTARGWIGPILSWAAAITAIIVVAVMITPDGWDIVEPPERVNGEHIARGGPTNEGISGGGVTEATGVYWEPAQSLGQTLYPPVAGSIGIAVADRLSGTIYGFNQKTGGDRWVFEVGETLGHPLTVAKGVTGGGDPKPLVVWATASGSIGARPLLGLTATKDWDVDLDGNIVAPPVPGPSEERTTQPIYVAIEGTSGPQMVAIDSSSGAELWATSLASPVASGLAVTDTAIAFVGEDRRLTVLDPRQQGAPSCDLPTAGALDGQAPVIVGDYIVVPYPGGDLGVFSIQSGRCLQGYDWGNGLLPQPQLSLDEARKIAVVDDVFIYISEGALVAYDPSIWDPDRHQLDPAELDTAEKRAEAAEIQSELFVWDAPVLPPDGDTFTTDPLVTGELVLVGTQAGQLVAVSLSSGEIVWQFELDGPLAGEVAAVDGAVFAATREGTVFAVGGPAGSAGTVAPPVEFPSGSAPATTTTTEGSDDEPGDTTTSTEGGSDEGAGDTTTSTEGPSADEVAGQTGNNNAGRG